MKFAIVILALVAASQASFTGRLSEQARPILNDAVLKMRLVSSRSSPREAALTNNIIQNLQNQVSSILGHLEGFATQSDTAVQQLISQLQSTVDDLQSVAVSSSQGVMQIIQDFLQQWNSVIGNVFGSLFSGKPDRDISALLPHIQGILSHFNVQGHVSSVLSTVWAQTAATIIDHLGYTPNAQNAVASVLGQDVADWIWGHFGNDNKKGLLDGLQNLGNFINAATQEAIGNLPDILSQLAAVAHTNFQQIHELATNFAEQFATHFDEAQGHLSQAIATFLAAIKPLQAQLGPIYNEVVTAVTSILHGQN